MDQGIKMDIQTKVRIKANDCALEYINTLEVLEMGYTYKGLGEIIQEQFLFWQEEHFKKEYGVYNPDIPFGLSESHEMIECLTSNLTEEIERIRKEWSFWNKDYNKCYPGSMSAPRVRPCSNEGLKYRQFTVFWAMTLFEERVKSRIYEILESLR